MSLQDYFIGPECGVDIYEEPNEDKWVECSVKMAKFGAMVSVPIIIIIMMILIYYGDTLTRALTIIIGCGLIALIIAAPFYIIPGAARVQHQRFQKELNSRIANGMTREQAISELQRERLKREEIAAIQGNRGRRY